MAIYDDILNQAGGNHKAAGDLHELLWERLLRREDPRFHNVRITRGDGGIDGFVLQDPMLATATVFQAKFFSDISSDEHRAAIQKAFSTAHDHTFRVVDWILLLPIAISHGDLNWLVGETLKTAAKAVLDSRKHRNIDACIINYRIASHLEDLCRRHLDVVAELLPASTQALLQQIATERNRADALQVEIADRLRLLNDEAIRQRQVEVHRVRSALRLLYQGWGNHIVTLEQAKQLNWDAYTIEHKAADLERFAELRTSQALAIEGLYSDINEQIGAVYRSARMLRASAVQAQIDPQHTLQMKAELNALISAVRELSRSIGRP